MTFRRSTFGMPAGGGVAFGPGMLSPFIKWMLIVNGGIFLLQLFRPEITGLLGLTPALFFKDFPNYLYSIVTYMFLHGGIGHILFNMFALWMFGTEIEMTWGPRRFARFYLIGGIAGAIATLLVLPSQLAVTIGASAAIYSVLIAYWLMFPSRYIYIWFLFPVKVKYFVPGFMLLGFLAAAPGVAHMAHLGGALWGLLYMKSDWRMIGLGGKLKNLRYRRTEAKVEKRRRQAEDTMRRVDEILDKINEVGLENLTPEERKFLEDASSELSSRKQRSENSH